LAGQQPAQSGPGGTESPASWEGVTPAQYLGRALKTIPSSFAAILKNVRLLKPAIAFTALWIILGILPIVGVYGLPVRILSFLTFAQGGLLWGGFYGALGVLGGTLGRVTYAYLIMPLLQGQRPFSGVGAGLKRLPDSIAFDTGSLVPLAAGGAMALLTFNFMTGNASWGNIMPIIAALILSLRALGRPDGFLRGLIRSFVQTYGRSTNPEQVTSRILAGLTCGFAVAIPLSFTSLRMVGYVAALLCLVAAVVIRFWPRKQPGALVVLAILALSAWPVQAGPGNSTAAQDTPGAGVVEIEGTGIRLNYNITGGQITEGPTDESYGGNIRLSMVGTVKPGETVQIEISGNGTTCALLNSYNQDGPSTLSAWVETNLDPSDRQDVHLEPGAGGSATASLVIPEDARTVEALGMISSVWFNSNGGGSADIIGEGEYQVEQPTPTPQPVAAAPEATEPPTQAARIRARARPMSPQHPYPRPTSRMPPPRPSALASLPPLAWRSLYRSSRPWRRSCRWRRHWGQAPRWPRPV
jgi:hypothetical protein